MRILKRFHTYSSPMIFSHIDWINEPSSIRASLTNVPSFDFPLYRPRPHECGRAFAQATDLCSPECRLSRQRPISVSGHATPARAPHNHIVLQSKLNERSAGRNHRCPVGMNVLHFRTFSGVIALNCGLTSRPQAVTSGTDLIVHGSTDEKRVLEYVFECRLRMNAGKVADHQNSSRHFERRTIGPRCDFTLHSSGITAGRMTKQAALSTSTKLAYVSPSILLNLYHHLVGKRIKEHQHAAQDSEMAG